MKNELVSKENVCEYINLYISRDYSTAEEISILTSIIKGIQAMPNEGQQIGKWYSCGFECYECSICGCTSKEQTHYCSNCGAKIGIEVPIKNVSEEELADKINKMCF